MVDPFTYVQRRMEASMLSRSVMDDRILPRMVIRRWFRAGWRFRT